MSKARMMKVKDHERVVKQLSRPPAPPQRIVIDVAFLKPLAGWYAYMPEKDKAALPIRVANALDSLHEILGGRL